jgi:hypothetical protein
LDSVNLFFICFLFCLEIIHCLPFLNLLKLFIMKIANFLFEIKRLILVIESDLNTVITYNIWLKSNSLLVQTLSFYLAKIFGSTCLPWGILNINHLFFIIFTITYNINYQSSMFLVSVSRWHLDHSLSIFSPHVYLSRSNVFQRQQ